VFLRSNFLNQYTAKAGITSIGNTITIIIFDFVGDGGAGQSLDCGVVFLFLSLC
jgi:hypothetical protein